MKIIWQEFKYLDKSTNHSSRTEMIKKLKKIGDDITYYCTYKKEKKYYGLSSDEIKYVNISRIPKIRGIIFYIRLFLLNLYWCLIKKPDIIMLDNYLIKVALVSVWLNKILKGNIKYVLDIRTIPVNPKSFSKDMRSFHRWFNFAVRYFDGLSFITPYMGKYLMKGYRSELPTVIWTSGINEELFNPYKYIRKEHDYFELFYHGGLSTSRGILEIMKATKILREKGYDVRLKLIGTLVNKNEIYSFYNSNNMESYCNIIPPVLIEEIPQHIVNTDFPIMAMSGFDGWRVSSFIKFLEYLGMGKKVIVTDIEAFTDITNDNDMISIATSEKGEDLAIAVEKAIQNNKPINCKKIRKFIIENYTWNIQAEKLNNFFKDLIQK